MIVLHFNQAAPPALTDSAIVAEACGTTACASITSPALVINTGDPVYVACRAAAGITSITVTSSPSKTWTQGTLSNTNATAAVIQPSWINFTLNGGTQPHTEGYWTTNQTVLNLGNGATEGTGLTTNQRTYVIDCSSVDNNPVTFTAGLISTTTATLLTGTSTATTGDMACEAAAITVATTGFKSAMSDGNQNWVGTASAFNY